MTRVMNSFGHIVYECEYFSCGKQFDTAEEQIHHEVHHYKALIGFGCKICDKK